MNIKKNMNYFKNRNFKHNTNERTIKQRNKIKRG